MKKNTHTNIQFMLCHMIHTVSKYVTIFFTCSHALCTCCNLLPKEDCQKLSHLYSNFIRVIKNMLNFSFVCDSLSSHFQVVCDLSPVSRGERVIPTLSLSLHVILFLSFPVPSEFSSPEEQVFSFGADFTCYSFQDQV